MTLPCLLAALSLLAAPLPANAFDSVRLSLLPEGYEIDRLEEPGKPTLPRVAWSRSLDTVVYAARSEERCLLAVNSDFKEAEEVVSLSFTPDGRLPVHLTRRHGQAFLAIGDRTYGPYDAVERPALSPDGRHHAFKARSNGEELIISDGARQAHGGVLTAPVLDPVGRTAYWSWKEKRWTLWWDERAAPGTPFPSRTSSFDASNVGTPVFSPDGSHVAFWKRTEGDRFVVVRDGKAGEPILAVGEMAFSPDSRFLAYGEASGPDFELNTLVIDPVGGESIKTAFLKPLQRAGGAAGTTARSIRTLWGLRFLEDGRLLYFASLAGGKSCFVVGDKVSGEFDSISLPALDPASRRIAFAAKENRHAKAVVDGSEGPPFDSIPFLQFDPTGRRLAYTAKLGTATYVVVEGVPGTPYDEVGWVRFSEDGRTVAHWARRGGRWFVVVDGRESPVGVSASLVGNLILAGAAGKTSVFSTREDGRWYLIAGSERAGPYDEIGSFHYDPVSDRVVCGVRSGREFLRVLIPVGQEP